MTTLKKEPIINPKSPPNKAAARGERGGKSSKGA
jgi:hypothetical protein